MVNRPGRTSSGRPRDVHIRTSNGRPGDVHIWTSKTAPTTHFDETAPDAPHTSGLTPYLAPRTARVLAVDRRSRRTGCRGHRPPRRSATSCRQPGCTARSQTRNARHAPLASCATQLLCRHCSPYGTDGTPDASAAWLHRWRGLPAGLFPSQTGEYGPEAATRRRRRDDEQQADETRWQTSGNARATEVSGASQGWGSNHLKASQQPSALPKPVMLSPP